MLERMVAAGAATLMLAGCSKDPAPVTITGSATVLPFTRAVADRFTATVEGAVAPRIETTGTIAGIRAFCAGPGAPDLLDASRRIERTEYARCRTNKVGEILEIPIGLDGVALAQSDAGPKLSLASKDLYLALAATPLGKPNTTRTWRDVNPALPAIPIKVLGPSATAGTRDAFVALILAPGCTAADPGAAALRNAGDPAKFDMACNRIRSDGAYVEAGEDYAATARELVREPQAIGVFGYSYLEKSGGKLRGIALNGIEPDAESIGGGSYAGARQLYLYAKKAHIEKKPAVQQFLDLYADMWRPGGPLQQAGLIPLSTRAAARSADVVKNGFPLETDDLP